MERFGFVGLPNAGKSSLYNALAGGGALAAPYAFATVDPNVGVARVPDDRVERLAEMSGTSVLIHATVQFVDIAGLVKGAAQGEGLGNRFLSHIREVDALVFVLRAFHDDDVPGSNDPLEQLETLEVELVYADLESLEKQIDKARADDVETIVGEAVDFFQLLAAGLDNRVMLAMLQSLNMMIGASLARIIDAAPNAKKRIADAQGEIIAAIEARDETKAAEWMARHIDDLMRGYKVAKVDLQARIYYGA